MNNGCAVHLLSPSRAVWPDCSAGWRRSSPSGVDSETPGRSTSSRLTPSNIYHSHLWLHLWVTARLNNISGLYPHYHTLKQPLVVSFHHSRLELHIYQNKPAPCTPSVAPVALASTDPPLSKHRFMMQPSPFVDRVKSVINISGQRMSIPY